MFTETDYYEILQVSPEAEPEVIQAAYRSLARKHHPDRNRTASSLEMQRINAAYEVLSDPIKRQRYDERRRSTGSRPFDHREPSQRASRQDYPGGSQANYASAWRGVGARWSLLLAIPLFVGLFFLGTLLGTARFLQDQTAGTSTTLSAATEALRRPELSALDQPAKPSTLQPGKGSPLESVKSSLQTLNSLRNRLPVSSWPMGDLTERLAQVGQRLPFLNQQPPASAFLGNPPKSEKEAEGLPGLLPNGSMGSHLPVIVFLGIEAALFLAILAVWRRQARRR